MRSVASPNDCRRGALPIRPRYRCRPRSRHSMNPNAAPTGSAEPAVHQERVQGDAVVARAVLVVASASVRAGVARVRRPPTPRRRQRQASSLPGENRSPSLQSTRFEVPARLPTTTHASRHATPRIVPRRRVSGTTSVLFARHLPMPRHREGYQSVARIMRGGAQRARSSDSRGDSPTTRAKCRVEDWSDFYGVEAAPCGAS